MQFHDYANLFPMMEHSEMLRLADDIKEKGQQDPIITHEGKILDGRNRYKACLSADVSPRFEEYTGDDALGYVISHNLHRRHLTESQRGMIAAKVATMKNGGNNRKDVSTPPIDGVPSVKDREQAAKEMSVGISTLDRARKIQRIGATELVEAVESGQVTVGAAYKVAELPQEEQREVVAAGPEAIKAKAKEMREDAQANHQPNSPPQATIPKATRHIKIKESNGMAIFASAKSVMERLSPKDTQWRESLESMISYCQNRIQNNK